MRHLDTGFVGNGNALDKRMRLGIAEFRIVLENVEATGIPANAGET